MNGKIKELIDATATDTGGRWVSVDILEHFAIKVVEECADHINSSSDRYRREYFADKILTHFGIKK
jgi:hypothetical protein